jgi:hypothetical protein
LRPQTEADAEENDESAKVMREAITGAEKDEREGEGKRNYSLCCCKSTHKLSALITHLLKEKSDGTRNEVACGLD